VSTTGLPTIVIATGGTGGHVFPGLAVADALRALAEVDVVFVGTPRGLEKDAVPARGYPIELLDVAPIKGVGPARAVKAALIAARETAKAVALVRRLRPQAVLSIGGYAAGPVSLAAAALGIPVAVLEPNSIVGLANRLLAPVAARAYVAWEETSAPFRKGRSRLLGVPLRAGFMPHPYTARSTARVLVMGGSQGASALNERLPQAIARALRDVPGIEVMHQSGRARDAAVVEAYAREGVAHAKVAPFVEDVARELARADLVVARSGAVTVAEIAAIGRAAILVPYPHAADDHQAKNALALEKAGGALCIRQESADAVRLGTEIARLLGDHALRTRMADASAVHGRPTAASDVARDLLALAGVALTPRPHGTNGARYVNGKGKRAYSEAN
jgi:UDP-N-acetylglucosamine--N-acetylmuramyl-(pentapeptide) pyrophosphoryl-undecaprenol N-acetylglucosamine transferase